jgi:hypothetical protein
MSETSDYMIFRIAADFFREFPEAHSEIKMLLPDGSISVIPAKNEEMLRRAEAS